jgi:hypothetical protein
MNHLKDLEALALDFLLYRKQHSNTFAVSSDDSSLFIDSEIDDIDVTNKSDSNHIFMQEVSCDVSKQLSPMVSFVLNENRYNGSPLHQNLISREYLSQLTDQVIEHGRFTLNEIEEIGLECEGGLWSRYRFLRAFIEQRILHEIFCVKDGI